MGLDSSFPSINDIICWCVYVSVFVWCVTDLFILVLHCSVLPDVRCSRRWRRRTRGRCTCSTAVLQFWPRSSRPSVSISGSTSTRRTSEQLQGLRAVFISDGRHVSVLEIHVVLFLRVSVLDIHINQSINQFNCI